MTPRDNPPPGQQSRGRRGPLRAFGSLRARLLVGFLLVALVPLGVIVVADERAARGLVTESAYLSLAASASRTAVRLDAFLSSNLTIVGTEAKLPIFSEYLALSEAERAQRPTRDALLGVLASLALRDRVFIASYALLDTKGRNLADTRAGGEADESTRHHFAHAIEYDEPSISSIEFLPTDGNPYLNIGSPVHDASGVPVGVLRVQYSAAVLKQIAVEGSGAPGGESFSVVLDDQGMVVAGSLDSAPDGSSLLFSRLSEPTADERPALSAARRLPVGSLHVVAEPELRAALGRSARDQHYFSCRLDGYAHLDVAAGTTRLQREPWTVVSFLPKQAFLAPVDAQSRSGVAFAMVVLGLVTVAATVVARSLARPISRLTESAQRLATGDLEVAVEVTAGGEIGFLQAAFRRMAGDIKRLVDDLADRNRELHASNDALQEQNVLLEAEIIERARNEVILREQQEAIRLLSTPILAVWEGVLALPVIGVIDRGRASQMMEKLLDEIVRSQASIAILDLTGVERVDGPTAGYLLNIVRAASLLGSRCVLSGISPQTSREMVGIDLGEGAFVSFRTLEDALRYAVGKRTVGRAAASSAQRGERRRG